MTRTFITRLQILAAVLAALAMVSVVGLVAPVDAHGASTPQCSVQHTGYTGMLRTRCVSPRPSAKTRTFARRTARTNAACSIGYLAALDPDPVRRWC